MQYIARISYGKDSLKMLEVIHSRGLPLDRITTTDVWATETISANLPPMEAFKARMDERIWELYRIEVEHLCARNKDGTKKTYEQMFYHVPQRRLQTVQVERERERTTPTRSNSRLPGFVEPMVSIRSQTGIKSTGNKGPSKASRVQWGSTGVKSSNLCRINGFPAQISPWCKKLKIDKVRTPLFECARHDGQKKYRGIYWNCSRRTKAIWSTQRQKASAVGRVRNR